MPPDLPARSRGRRHLVALVALVAAVAAVAAAGCVAPPPVTSTNVVTGLNRPWDLGFLPDGDVVFTEKAGRISIYDGGQTPAAGPAGRRRVGRRGRDDGPRRRPRVRQQPPDLHLLPVEPRRARSTSGWCAGG